MLNPNNGFAWISSRWVRLLNGEPELAIAHLEYAMRLSPFDIGHMSSWIALTHLLAGRYGRALSASEQGWPNRVEDLTVLAASSALAGRMDKARAAMAYIREPNPTRSVSTLKVLVPFRRPRRFRPLGRRPPNGWTAGVIRSTYRISRSLWHNPAIVGRIVDGQTVCRVSTAQQAPTWSARVDRLKVALPIQMGSN
jgi:hypothetical protein